MWSHQQSLNVAAGCADVDAAGVFFFLVVSFSQTKGCLEELMQSDEDMLGLLLTETKELREGEVTEAGTKGGRGGERM